MSDRTALEGRLRALMDERLCIELSDDFAFTNGRLGRINAQIASVNSLLSELPPDPLPTLLPDAAIPGDPAHVD